MSGHSHWAGIKHKKEIVDVKRGKLFSVLSKAISIAAQKNPDPETNPSLRTIVEKARKANMPKERIDKAIGGAEKEGLEEVFYEAIGPASSGFLIKIKTDNKNRTLGEIKIILKKHGARIGNVRWMFTGTTPNYPLQLKNPEKEKNQALIKDLQSQADTEEVYTNLAG